MDYNKIPDLGHWSGQVRKWAEIGTIKRIYNFFWLLLPVLTLGVGFLILYAVYVYVSGQMVLSAKTDELNKVQNDIGEMKQDLNALKAYSDVINAFNDYKGALLNYDLLFKTLGNYLPKNMDRKNVTISKEANKINVSVAGKITGYQSYMSIMRLVDKCNFSSEKDKNAFLNISKVTLGDKDTNGEDRLGTEVQINIGFSFDIEGKNKLLKQLYFDRQQENIAQLGHYMYLYKVVTGQKDDNFGQLSTASNSQETNFYANVMHDVYNERDSFIGMLSKKANVDRNGFFMKSDNGIGKEAKQRLEQENDIADFYIAYLSQLRSERTSWLTRFISDYPEDKDITVKIGKKEIKIVNIHKEAVSRIDALGQEIAKLKLIKRYNTYLMRTSVFNTFASIKDQKKILEIIDKNGIFSQNDELLSDLLPYEVQSKQGITITKSESDKANKAQYAKAIDFLTKIDTQKASLLDTKSYIERYDERFYTTSMLDVFAKIIKVYKENNYNEEVLNAFNTKSFNFSLKNTNSATSYKKKFFISMKENSDISNQLVSLLPVDAASPADATATAAPAETTAFAWYNPTTWFGSSEVKKEEKAAATVEQDPALRIKGLATTFNTKMKLTEAFFDESSDVITFNNAKIDCLTKDIKTEIADINTEVMGARVKASETKEGTKRSDLIINATIKTE